MIGASCVLTHLFFQGSRSDAQEIHMPEDRSIMIKGGQPSAFSPPRLRVELT